jgi:NAD(P)-dependent dehydrogenase (short-subunit alcohol dehydrogenase family)
MSRSGARKGILITGAGSGIGRATAQLFAKRGWFVGAYDVNEAGLAETVGLVGAGACVSGVFDVRDRQGWADAVSGFGDATGGRLHVLMNNAGIGRHGAFADITPEDSDAIIDINVKGVINGTYAALPLLEKTPGARIVNVASVAGIVGSPQLAVYSASKFAVRGLSEALDVELAGKGFRVTTLAPWFVDTPILDMSTSPASNHRMRDDIAAGKMTVYPVEMAAEQAWEAAHGERQLYTVGKMARSAAFMQRFFPGTLQRRLKRQILGEG